MAINTKKYEELIETPPVYSESEETSAAREQVNAWESKIPTGEYKGTYSAQIDKLVSDYLGRDKFNYNPNSDSVYQQLRDSQLSAGKTAMQDTLGNATALSGGNNNSSAQVAAQQVYNNYAKGVSDAIPQLEQNAYNRYQAEGAQKLQDISLLQSRDDTEYSRYQANLQNIQNFLNYYYGKYQGEQARDEANFQNAFMEWQTKLNAGQTDYWNQAQMDYQIGRDNVTDKQNENSVLMNLGWQKLQAGVRPNKSELVALGMTAAEADKIIANIQTQSVSKGGGSGNSSSGGSKSSSSGNNKQYTKSAMKQLYKDDIDGFYGVLKDQYPDIKDRIVAAQDMGISSYITTYIYQGLTSLEQVDYMLKNYKKAGTPDTVKASNAMSKSEFYSYGNINSEYDTYADYLMAMFNKYIDI